MKSKTGLLDINVLIALIDPAHQFHLPADAWFQLNRRRGWATCPITENGCLRIMSNPGYPFPGLTVERVRGILCELIRLDGHRFWPDSVTLLAPLKSDAKTFDLTQAGPKQLTDLYLLGLAISNGGRLITFDRTIPVRAIAAFRPGHLEVLTKDS